MKCVYFWWAKWDRTDQYEVDFELLVNLYSKWLSTKYVGSIALLDNWQAVAEQLWAQKEKMA